MDYPELLVLNQLYEEEVLKDMKAKEKKRKDDDDYVDSSSSDGLQEETSKPKQGPLAQRRTNQFGLYMQ